MRVTSPAAFFVVDTVRYMVPVYKICDTIVTIGTYGTIVSIGTIGARDDITQSTRVSQE